MTVSRRDPHLGELAAALVDGALDHGARDRALIHLTRCDSCRAEVDAQRRLKAQLANMFCPAAPAGLAERLRTLPDRVAVPAAAPVPVELPPDRFAARFRPGARPGSYRRAVDGRTVTTISGVVPLAPVPVAPVPVPVRPGGGRPAGAAAAVRGPGRRRRRYVATAASGLAAFALALAAVAAAGDAPQLEPVAPQVGTFIQEHASVTGGMPGPDAEVGVVDAAYLGK